VFNELTYIPAAWARMLANRNFRNQFFISILIFVLVGMHDLHYLRLWQSRPGYQINDIILNHLHPYNFSLPIFILEYITLLLVVVFLLVYPERFVQGLQMASMVVLARTMSVYFIALEPPKDMVALNDPFANFFLHTKDIFVTKDLFFSGHISILALVCLVATHKYVKVFAITATVLVAAMLLCQHVHYSLDIFCAPFVAFASYKFVQFIHREAKLETQLSRQENW
jgi:PAP2 superfamily C-terminal